MANIVVTGVDFSDRALNVVIIQCRGIKRKILAWHRFEFASDIFKDDRPVDYQNIVNKLRIIKNDQPLFRHKVALAIPDAAVMTKIISTDKRLPFTQQCFSATHSFSTTSPLPLNQLALDCLPCAEGVLIYAAKQKVIDQRAYLIAQAGMAISLVDTEKQACWQLLSDAQICIPDKRYWLLEITETAMTLAFFNQDNSGKDDSLYRYYPMEYENQNFTGSSSENLDKKLSKIDWIKQRLKSEIERSRTLHTQCDWHGIWVIGQLDHDDLFTQLAETTGLSVEAYPFDRLFKFKSKPTLPTTMPLTIGKACGIALRGIQAVKHNYAA